MATCRLEGEAHTTHLYRGTNKGPFLWMKHLIWSRIQTKALCCSPECQEWWLECREGGGCIYRECNTHNLIQTSRNDVYETCRWQSSEAGSLGGETRTVCSLPHCCYSKTKVCSVGPRVGSVIQTYGDVNHRQRRNSKRECSAAAPHSVSCRYYSFLTWAWDFAGLSVNCSLLWQPLYAHLRVARIDSEDRCWLSPHKMTNCLLQEHQ